MTSIVESAAPYWEACARRELRLPRCAACGLLRFPPRPACPRCGSQAAGWAAVSGRGALYSWAVAPGRPDAGEPGYVLALVELDEGPRIVANLVDCDPGALTAGMPLELTWIERDGDPAVVPGFRPAATTEPARRNP